MQATGGVSVAPEIMQPRQPPEPPKPPDPHGPPTRVPIVLLTALAKAKIS